NAQLPVHSSSSNELLNGSIIQRIYEIDHDLPEVHKMVLYQLQTTQQKQKERMIDKLKPHLISQ
ncbi:35524_t:CDS:1, partial [Racocetra persica]